MKKKKSLLWKISIVLTAVSGTVLTIVTGGLALPLVVVKTAIVIGAFSTGMLVLDKEFEGEKE